MSTATGILAFLIFSGCQSPLIDPGRPRSPAHPPQMLLPAPPAVQPVAPQGPITEGATHPDWNNVARQPAASVIQMSPTETAQARYHTVLPGESWSSLAQQHGVTVKQLADANGMDPSATLLKGQIVYIPEK